MALSPPGANSVTIAVIVPPAAVATTEYCASAASVETLHGSTRAPEPGVSATVVVVTSVPSLKRNHWSVALVAVTLWMRIGVVKPTPLTGVGQKQRDLVMFGRKYFVAGAPVPEYAMSVVALSGFTWTARFEPAPPVTVNAYSPSARQVAEPPLHSDGLDELCVSKLKRGSKAFDELGWIAGKVYVFAVPKPPA